MLLTALNRDSNSNTAVVSTSSKKTSKEAQVYKIIIAKMCLHCSVLAGISVLSGISRCLEVTARWRSEWR